MSGPSLRIAHLLANRLGETFGGIEVYVDRLARRQVDRGHRVAVLAGSEERSAEPEDPEHERCQGIDRWTFRRTWAPDELYGPLPIHPRIRDQLAGVTSAFRPDVVHVHHWFNLSIELVRTLRRQGVPIVLTLHDHFAVCPLFFRLRNDRFCEPLDRDECTECLAPSYRSIGGEPARLPEQLAARDQELRSEIAAADVVLALSDHQRDSLQRTAVVEGFDISVPRIGGPDHLGGPRPLPVERPNRLRIGFWSGLGAAKGAELLVTAVATSAYRDRMSVELLGREGDPALRERLIEKGAGVDLRLGGAFREEDKLEFGRRFDVAAFPSLYAETHGMALDEALALGLPVVVSNRGALPERVGRRGLVVEPTAAALREAFEALLSEPGLLRRLAAAPSELPPFGEHAERLERIYRSLTRGG